MLKSFTRKPTELVVAPAEPETPPTQMARARAALVAATELVAALTSRAQECAAMVGALPPIDPRVPIDSRFEAEDRADKAKSIAERIARELNQARSDLRLREQELETLQAQSEQAQRNVRYYRTRLAPHLQYAAELRAMLQAIPPNIQAIAYALPDLASVLLQAQNSLEVELHHVIPERKRELAAAEAEATRIGV